MKVVLDRIDKLTNEIHMLWFKPERAMDYVAGQYTQIQLKHDETDERGDKRWFTLSSSPTEDMLAITTRFVNGKRSTFKQKLSSLKVGAELNLADAMGDFVLPKDKSIPLVFVAGGIGVTPMRSMIKWLSDTNEKRNIHLIYGVRTETDAVFGGLFEDYGAKIDIVAERLTADKILELTGNVKEKLIYISGPEPMVEALFDALKSKGVEDKRLVGDYFPGYPAF